MAIIYTGDTPNFEISITENGSPVDLSGAATLELVFAKPSGEQITKSATNSGDNNEIASAALGVGEVDEAGLWSVQAQITGLDGWSGSAAKKQFVVDPAL
jgi:hypothetical protein